MKTKTQVAKFNTSKKDMALIEKLADRLEIYGKKFGVELEYDRLEFIMDLDACNSNGTPLDFQKLLDADDFNFGHDVWGIRAHIDRTTGKVKDFFMPRCSLRRA